MTIRCFYHSADLDGHCSGAIVKFKYPEAIMHPINYGDEFPWGDIQSDDVIYMVDFALQPFSDMKRLAGMVERGNLRWYDHHSSAIGEWQRSNPEPWFPAQVRSDMAACEIVWICLFPFTQIPLAVKLLSLYDSWTYQGHELEDWVLPFQMRMRLEDFDPKNWNKCKLFWTEAFEILHEEEHPKWNWINFTGSKLIEEGKLILRYDEQQKKKYTQTYAFNTILQVDAGFDLTDNLYPFGRATLPLKAVAINLGHTNSKVFDSIWNEEKHDIMITFVRRKDRLWNVSLYSTRPDVDCGEIAKSFGGGGHKGAAGFQCASLPFIY